MKSLPGRNKFLRRMLLTLLFSTALCAGASSVYAQCATSDNIGWGRGATVRFFLEPSLNNEQKRQIRWALAEWNRANSVNHARVRFEEDSTGQNFQFRFLNGSLGGNVPAFAGKNFTSDGTVVSATLTFDPNATFAGTSILIGDPNQPGYENYIIKLTLHEVGHTMGLDHPSTASGNPCDQPDGATIMNYICNINDAANNMPLKLTTCDQNTINSLPRYPAFNQSPNPIDESRTFVRQHYLDFLNREPDAAGLSFWTDQIISCGADAACRDNRRQNVSAAFFLSAEFQQTGYFVYRAYKAAFGDIPGKPVPITIQEFLPETQQVARGVVVNQPGWEQLLEANIQAWLNEFVQRRRFLAVYGSMSNEQFIDTLNARTGGVLSTDERNSLVARLNGGQISRAQALREVADDADLRALEFNRAFVLMEYFGYLRRNPEDPPEPTLDFAGYNFWLRKLNEHNGDYIGAQMVRSFLISGEYRARFGQP
ncbi:MAG TPA: DUF4214 domain-containing protein [Pyrinomonadaceae bacterium]|jgi:hypothetical protein